MENGSIGDIQSVDAGFGGEAGCARDRLALPVQRSHVQLDGAGHPLDVGQARQRAQECGVVGGVEPNAGVDDAVEARRAAGRASSRQSRRRRTPCCGRPRWNLGRALRGRRPGGRPTGSTKPLSRSRPGACSRRRPGSVPSGQAVFTTWPRSCSAARAAPSPHMPCTPPPGGVAAEHR